MVTLCGPANLLAGNPQAAGAAVLEMTLQGGKYQFDGDAVFALAGADMPAALDGRPVPAYTPLLARAGQVLAIGAARSGLRGYLAGVWRCGYPARAGQPLHRLKMPDGRAGWPRTESWGCAAHWGGTRHGGTALAADLRQRGKPPAGHGAHPRKAVAAFGRAEAAAVPVRCPAPRPDAFTAAGQAAFVHGVYALTADCDRMACKLQGPQIETVDGSDIVSDGIVAGSVQVSANGQPIVMLADHQTTGGYAKIATVISADLSGHGAAAPRRKAGVPICDRGAGCCRSQGAGGRA